MTPSSPNAGDREVYSVARLNREARDALERGFGNVWVDGEISNLARPASGHLYFTLKDSRAQVSCALFRNRAVRLDFTPQDGDQVLLRAQVSLYEPRGNYQLIVQHMEEAGDGALRRAFEALKHRLFEEGLFDESRKRPLPEPVRHLGVITSPGGAAIHDVLAILARRYPGLPVTIFPTQVQGERAAAQIVSALQQAARFGQCDVLLLTRGGGSLEDLWPFNEESVARAVHACPLPVVSAVGHEVDVVITDFVADRRAATPSAAAEMLSPDRAELVQRLLQLGNRLRLRVGQVLEQRDERLRWLGRRLMQTHPGRQLQQQAQQLDELEQRLLRAWSHFTLQRHNRLQYFHGRLLRCDPRHRLENYANRLTQIRQQLVYQAGRRLAGSRERLQLASRALDMVSPLATLERGYSITLDVRNGRTVQDASCVKRGAQLETRLARGIIISQVEDIRDT